MSNYATANDLALMPTDDLAAYLLELGRFGEEADLSTWSDDDLRDLIGAGLAAQREARRRMALLVDPHAIDLN